MATMPRPPMPPMPGGPGGMPPPPGPGGMPGPPGAPPSPLTGPLMQQAMQGLAGGMPGGDPAAALRSLQMTPPPDNVEVAIKRGQQDLGYAMSQIHQRSPEVAKELASALMNIKQALQKLQMLPRDEPGSASPQLPRGLPMAGGLFGGAPPGPAPGPPGL